MRKPATIGLEAEAIPSGSPCPFCIGSGACAKCEGAGKRIFRKGPLKVRRAVECAACGGTGTCDLCQGLGIINSDRP